MDQHPQACPSCIQWWCHGQDQFQTYIEEIRTKTFQVGSSHWAYGMAIHGVACKAIDSSDAWLSHKLILYISTLEYQLDEDIIVVWFSTDV